MKLIASLAPARAEIEAGVVAEADQYIKDEGNMFASDQCRYKAGTQSTGSLMKGINTHAGNATTRQPLSVT